MRPISRQAAKQAGRPPGRKGRARLCCVAGRRAAPGGQRQPCRSDALAGWRIGEQRGDDENEAVCAAPRPPAARTKACVRACVCVRALRWLWASVARCCGCVGGCGALSPPSGEAVHLSFFLCAGQEPMRVSVISVMGHTCSCCCRGWSKGRRAVAGHGRPRAALAGLAPCRAMSMHACECRAGAGRVLLLSSYPVMDPAGRPAWGARGQK